MYPLRYLLFFSIIIFNGFSIKSQDPALFTSSGDGLWDAATTWTITGSDGDNIPDADDTVIISHNITCSSTANSLIAVFNINPGGSILLDPTYRLQVWGHYVTSSITGTGNITGPGVLSFVLSHTVEGTGSIDNVSLQINNWYNYYDLDLTVNDVTIAAGGGFQLSSGNTMTINGDFYKLGSAQRIQNNGTFIINDPDFMTLHTSPEDELYSSTADIIYNATGDFPVPTDGGYVNVTIGGNATCSGDITITGNYTNTGTFNSSNNDNITFSGTTSQSISGSGTSNFKNLTLNNSNGLDITAGTVNIEQVFDLQSGDVDATGSTVVLESNSDNTAGQLNLGSSTYAGNLTVERYVPTSSQGYRMFGSPVETATSTPTTLADWMDDGVIFSGFPGSNFPTFWGGENSFTYDESLATNSDKEAGWVPSFDISNPTHPSLGTFIYTDASTYTLSVTGFPYQGTIPISVQSGGTTDQRGWNLIANPYPCNLDWDLFHADNSAIVDDAYWIYDGNAGNLVFYAGAGGGTLSSVMSHSQGIWVHKTSVGTSSINFEQSHLSTTATNYIKSTNGINNPLQIKISGDVNGYHDYSFIKAVPNATMDFDQGLDLYKFFSPIPDEAPNVFIETNDGYIVGAAFINNNQSIDIPVGIEIGSLAAGNYTLDFTDINQFMIGSCLTLEDLENGTITDLRSDSSYTFSSSSSVSGPRFILHVYIDYDITVSNENCFITNDGEILLTGNNISGSYFQLFNNNVLIDSIVAINDSVNFNYLNAGTYTINTDHVGTCSMNNQEIIITQPSDQVIASFEIDKDTVYLDQSGEVVFNNLSSGSISYLWNFGDGNTSTDINPVHTYSNQGVYPIILYADNENIGVCTDVTINNLIVLPTDPNTIDELFNFSFNIYQLHNEVVIQYENENFDFCYLTDISGKRVTNKILRNAGSSNITINVHSITSGIYFLSFEDEYGLVYSRKLFLN